MPRIPSIAVVLEGGLLQAFIVEDWPNQSVLPRVAIVDHDTEGADANELTPFAIGSEIVEAFCRGETPLVYEGEDDVLSPNLVLAAIGEPVNDEDERSPLEIVRELRKYMVESDEMMIRNDQAPTGQDYNDLYRLVHDSLMELLRAMGQPVPVSG
ncbi:hypothetical protein [Achromobacter pestifer]|uniref:Uncharacterized protein n=1 Tax=Achromobacter pestifer TaxID=1353889 RepID=A0A6S6ZHB0_9BURK|nr:hypothetical protein [Achromobacter pestifer]CAB3648283.1 hypothetical protein LMG3431_02645 [Achromobacter pestifer]